jgi:hypothetical protein
MNRSTFCRRRKASDELVLQRNCQLKWLEGLKIYRLAI